MQKTNRRIAGALAIALTLGWAASAWAREVTVKDATTTLETLKLKDKALDKALTDATGYVVFPTIAKGAVGIGGAGGDGILFEKGKPVGKVSMSQVTIGLALGGQTYSELILFEDEKTLSDFKKGNFTFAAQTSAVALKEGASISAPYQRGVKVFSVAKEGLMFEASIGGQKFKYTPLNASEKVGMR